MQKSESARKLAEKILVLCEQSNVNGKLYLPSRNDLEAIIAAACQTVAPPPEPSRPGRTKLLMKFWSAMDLAGFPKDKEWDAQEKIHIQDLAQLMSGAVSTPRCPKCGSFNVTIGYCDSPTRLGVHSATCRVCRASCDSTGTMWNELFQPAPSPPQKCVHKCKWCGAEIFPDGTWGWARFGLPSCPNNPNGHEPRRE